MALLLCQAKGGRKSGRFWSYLVSVWIVKYDHISKQCHSSVCY